MPVSKGKGNVRHQEQRENKMLRLEEDMSPGKTERHHQARPHDQNARAWKNTSQGKALKDKGKVS